MGYTSGGASCAAAVGGFANINPAMNCYFNVMNGPADGSGSVLSFDANTCYGSNTGGGGGGGGGGNSGPSTPTLNLPQFLPLNATITAGYGGSDPASYFSWVFTPQAQTGQSVKGAGASGQAPAAAFSTQSPSASLAGVSLGQGLYLVTVTVTDNNGVTSQPAQAYVTLVATDLSGVKVFPNPWRSDKHAGKSMTFANLTVNTTVKIFTVSGHHVKTLPTSSTLITWDLTNDSGDKVASGLYVYLITTDSGQKKTGQIGVIK